MTTIVKTTHAQDFLALVPQLVGFTPQNSIVFVAFRGNRTCAAVRFDLPDDSAEQHLRRVATSLVGMLSKLPVVDAVVPVVYTDRPYADRPHADRLHADAASPAPASSAPASSAAAEGSSPPHSPPHGAFVRAVIERFRFSGYRVRDALCVAGDAWGSYLDPECPASGRPLDDIAGSSALGEVPEVARSRFGEVEQWAALPEVDLVTKERVARNLRTLTRAFDSAQPGSRCLDEAGADVATALEDPGRMHDLTAVLELILSHDVARLDERAAAFVIAIARSPALRDVVMLQWAFDLETGDRVLDDAARFAAGEPADRLSSGGLMLGQGPRPDPERIDSAIELLKAIAARAPRPSRPPLLCMLAWLNWALGRSSVAHLFIVAAQEIDARYGLAELLRTVLDRGMLPEWAFAID